MIKVDDIPDSVRQAAAGSFLSNLGSHQKHYEIDHVAMGHAIASALNSMLGIRANDVYALLAEIDGIPVFAWRPVRLMCGAGRFDDGTCWLRMVMKRRYIGYPGYYYERISKDTPNAHA